MRLLNLSPNFPLSTHHFLLKALGRAPGLEVTSCGDPKWGPVDLACPPTGDISRLLERKGWLNRYDAGLYVEARGTFLPRGIHRLPFPVAGYLLDNDRIKDWAIPASALFDQVLVAQRFFRDELKRLGREHVEWVPFAADPEAYRRLPLPKEFEVGMVGTVHSHLHGRRERLLNLLGKHFKVCARPGTPADASTIYSSSRIVFNCTVYREITVRTFEAMACGSCLLTDSTKDGSLETLFEPGRHFLTFEDPSLVDTVSSWLARPDDLQQVADRGHQEFLRKHTFDCRAAHIRDSLARMCNRGTTRAPSRRTVVLLNLETQILCRPWSNRLWQRFPHPFWPRLRNRLLRRRIPEAVGDR